MSSFIKFLIVIVLFISPFKLSFSQIDTNNVVLNAEQIIDKYKPSLVSIWYTTRTMDWFTTSFRDTSLLSGSGFIISEDGLVGTNFHVVEPIDSILIKLSDGTFFNGEVVLIDEKNDIAILKIKDSTSVKFPFVRLGNADEVRQGQRVFAIGSPLGYEYTISEGIVAGLRENEKVSFYDISTYMYVDKIFEKVIQITAAISPGNSGGALFNARGEVIGITSYGYLGYGNLNFAISINTFKKNSDLIHTVDSASIAELELRREESLFSKSYKSATNIKSELYYDWIYSKQRDTMKIYDTLIVKYDSLNKINFDKAEKLYQKCITMRPDSFYVYSGLLDLYISTEKYDKADDFYKKIKEKFQSDSLINSLSYTLAQSFITQKDYNKAITFYEKILESDTSIYNYYQVASLYEKAGDYKKALRKYHEIIKKDSTYVDAYTQIGYIYYEKVKDYDKAKEYLQIAYVKNLEYYSWSSTSDIPYYLGMLAVEDGNKGLAILYYIELKSSYSYKEDDTKKKVELYKAIQEMND